ncbi:MAG: 50S ribosomal protein L23 [Puniceicoccales bacterium]|jgi:ribosomal protein L23|nr:50S ribosomal protein L23 [Puniceicoccales bacterium]
MNVSFGILKCFVYTEKASKLVTAHNQYTFRVDSNATSADVARAVFREFGFKPVRVNTFNRRGKVKRTRGSKRAGTVLTRKPSLKMAIVQLHPEEKIEIL